MYYMNLNHIIITDTNINTYDRILKIFQFLYHYTYHSTTI